MEITRDFPVVYSASRENIHDKLARWPEESNENNNTETWKVGGIYWM